MSPKTALMLPTPEQRQALVKFADHAGRQWKTLLRQAWRNGHYPWHAKDDSNCLQQIRNQFGPTWLNRLSPKTMKEWKSEQTLESDTRQEDTFLVSIYSERWTDDDKDAGEPGGRAVEVERTMVDADELKRFCRDYCISEPSATDPKTTPCIYFYSTFPPEDREYFEQGIEKYYNLHVHEVNGREPEAKEYQKVANLIGVKFDHPIELDPLYGYYINLDERGHFYADVRNADGSTIFEIRAGSSLGEDESSIFEDGFMRDKDDLSGLTEYLRGAALIPHDAEVLSANDFEQRLEAFEDKDTNNCEHHKTKRMRI